MTVAFPDAVTEAEFCAWATEANAERALTLSTSFWTLFIVTGSFDVRRHIVTFKSRLIVHS